MIGCNFGCNHRKVEARTHDELSKKKKNLFKLKYITTFSSILIGYHVLCSQISLAKTIWKSIHPRNLGNHVTVRRCVRTLFGGGTKQTLGWYLVNSATETGNPKHAACVCLGKKLSRWLKFTQSQPIVFLVQILNFVCLIYDKNCKQ